MEQKTSEPFLSAYRLFLARVVGAWCFLVTIVQWILGTLPFQLPHTGTNWLNGSMVTEILSVFCTTLLLVFFIVPTRIMAALCFMVTYVLAYYYYQQHPSLINLCFPLIFSAFIRSNAHFERRWFSVKVLLIIAAVFHAWLLPLTLMALPGYSCYLIASINWRAVFVRWYQTNGTENPAG